jgi:hypothetical protein
VHTYDGRVISLRDLKYQGKEMITSSTTITLDALALQSHARYKKDYPHARANRRQAAKSRMDVGLKVQLSIKLDAHPAGSLFINAVQTIDLHLSALYFATARFVQTFVL